MQPTFYTTACSLIPNLTTRKALQYTETGRWCGGERGQIYRISADGSSMAQVASTGGYCLGMAFDKEDNLYVCDLKHQAVIRVDTKSDTIDKFATDADGRSLRIPNFPVFDDAGRLYVSDSHAFKEPGPGIFRSRW